jgi:hypothetical protein
VSDRPKAPLTTTTSIWPAAAVLGIAVVMLVVFMLINAVSDQSVTTTTTVPTVVGGLAKSPNANALSYCLHTSEIPTNITGAFIVPVTTTIEPGANIPNAGAGDFDCYQPLSTTTNSGSLLAFYATQLEARGWSLFSRGASNGRPQSLFQKGGNDGFYWVVGITVNTTSNGRVHWTYRIYQNSESI